MTHDPGLFLLGNGREEERTGANKNKRIKAAANRSSLGFFALIIKLLSARYKNTAMRLYHLR